MRQAHDISSRKEDNTVNSSMLIELMGYLGSILVVVSMLMTSVVKLRVVNTVGAGIFAVYALMIHSYPTALMNSCLVIINIYNLAKLMKSERQYTLIDGRMGNSLLLYILKNNEEDIKKYFPEFDLSLTNMDAIYIIFNDDSPAGILLGRKKGEETIEVILDYSTPVYRDCSVGAYLYSKLREKGIHKLICTEVSEKHEVYLQKMGFVLKNGTYVKEL